MGSRRCIRCTSRAAVRHNRHSLRRRIDRVSFISASIINDNDTDCNTKKRPQRKKSRINAPPQLNARFTAFYTANSLLSESQWQNLYLAKA